MLLGALIDAGVPIEVIRDALDPLDLGVVLRVEQVNRAGLAATRVHVDVPESTTHRHLADVVGLLERVTEPTRSRAVAVFERLAGAEAMVHGISIAEVHFHEVGALDSIADVVGVCAGFVELGLAELHCSTLSLGSGQVNGAHGPIPVPAPAVLAVLEGLAPVTSGPAPFEATTPTGAALLAEWVSNWGPMPPMIVAASGVGAGARDSEIVANVVRFVVGSGGADRDAAIPNDVAIQIDANVDDLDPRLWPSVIMAAMDAGAFDAWVTPVVM